MAARSSGSSWLMASSTTDLRCFRVSYRCCHNNGGSSLGANGTQFDPDTGEIYPDIDGCLGDSIGNLWDLLGGD